ncbi:carboxypeptidase-like regulatory domain-containing protein [Mucilaginibacter antarcticus]|uniref:Carboxypeptidase-like regulatory domain-containing protein n=1 Tax=Mucilaginibacter antarcticus TaxID=1855725 RepID=A0ABW5XJG8_9SPHI
MKIKARYTLVIVGCLMAGLLAFTQKAEDPIDKVVASLQQWFDANPQEKVYLHTDKPYYLVGDTIWFKAYVTVGSENQLSAISGALYVDLITEGDSIAKQLKLPITTGMSVGNFVLDDDLTREGNYRIRAYTQWMRNAGADYFYDKTFTIGNSITNSVFAKIDYVYTKSSSKTNIKAILKYTDEKGNPLVSKNVSYQLKESYRILATGGGKTNAAGELSINLPNAKPGELSNSYLMTKVNLSGSETVPKTFPIKTASLQTDVQFFPESGSLINGVKSKVAFKATGTNGLGVAITGVINDSDNKQVAQIDVKHLGMGYFYLTPQAGKSYTATITYPDGASNTVNLPAAVNDGYVLSVLNQQKDSVLVRINTGATKAANTVGLIGQMGGKVYFSMTVPIQNGSAVVSLPTKEIASGILQLTLFSASGSPLNERVVFIQNNDNIDLKINSNKKAYARREKIDIDIDALSGLGKPVGGNFSMSVMSEDAVPSYEANENSIFSHILLSSDIKGYIEKPNYYFFKPSDDTKANLDILMLTQGYRRFNWTDVLSNTSPANTYKADKLINEITGKVVTFDNKPVAGGRVIIINNKTGFTRDTITDKNGRFAFTRLLITNGIDFTVQGANAKGGKRVNTIVDQVTPPVISFNKNIGDVNADIPTLIKTALENSLKQDLEMQKQGKPGRVKELREVRIRAAKPKFGAGAITESQADMVFRPDSRMPCTSLWECLQEANRSRVRFQQLLDTTGECGGPLWIPIFQQKTQYVILIDSVMIQPCYYQSVLINNTEDIAKVVVSCDSYAINAKLLGPLNLSRLNTRIPPPVIAIYTKSGNFRKSSDPSIVHYAPKGYDYVREFYAPKYNIPQNNPAAADLRSTVYWNPRILTGPTGHSKVSYYNSDQTGTYRVTIEGINAEGMLARKVYRYTVQ